MAALQYTHFDTFGFAKRLRELGASEEIAEYQARAFEQSIDIAVNQIKEELHLKDLTTKKDIELTRNEIKKTKVWMLIILGAGWMSLLGVLAKGFHWL